MTDWQDISTEEKMDTITYKDGSAAQVARYVVGDVGDPAAIDFGLNRRRAVAFAKRETNYFTGKHGRLDVIGLGSDDVPYAVWPVCYGDVGRRLDP